MSKNRHVTTILLVLLLVTSIVPVIEASGENWLTGWSYRKIQSINPATGAGTNYQMEIKVYYNEAPLDSFDSFEKDTINNPLTVPYYGAGGCLHPSVLYFPAGMDGYKYWMAYTPYPPGSKEEPCIVRSNNGITWTDTGITNPVVSRGADNEVPDPDILYISEYSKWFMVYNRDSPTRRRIYLSTSTDGKTWTEYGVLIDGSEDYEEAIPESTPIPYVTDHTIIYENGWFYIWYCVFNGGSVVNNKAWTCLAKFQWNDGASSVINFERDAGNPILRQAAGDGYDIGQGHIEVSEYEGTYYMWGIRWITGSGGRYDMCQWTSTDKTTWTYQGAIIEHGGSGDWDEQYVYRGGPVTDAEGSVCLLSDKVVIYYSGCPLGVAEPDIGIAYSVYGSDGGVGLDTKSRTDFGDIRFTSDDGSTELDYGLLEKVDSEYAIFWVEVSEDLSSSSATIYIYYGKADATTTSNPEDTFLLFDDFNDESIDTGKWTAFKKGSTSAIISELPDGTLQLAGEPDVVSSANLRSDSTFTNNFELRLKHEIDEEHYATTSMGSAGLQDEDGGTSDWWQTVMGAGYSYMWQTPVSGDTPLPAGDVSIRESPDGGAIAILEALDETALTTLDENHILTMQYFSDGEITWSHDDRLWLSTTDSTYLNNEKYILLSQGEYSGGQGGNRYIDWVFVRKCVDPEPTLSNWGSEEEEEEGNDPPNAPTLNAPDADSRWDMWEYVSFTWTFSDPDSGDIQSAYQLQLDDNSDFSSPLINTGKVSSGASVYNGYIPNTIGLFYWRVKTWDNHDLDGEYSSGRTIITSRILVYDISSDDGRLDIGTSATLTVHLHHEYDGTDITTGSFTLMGLALTHQSAGDWTTTHSRSTPQTITFNSVSGSTGNIDDVNMNGKTTTVIWDLIHATATQISDPRVSVNANVDIYFTLKYDFDETAVTDGDVTIEGETATHQGSGIWRITVSKSTTQSVTYDEFTASGGVYGITEVDAEGHSETATWDRWKLTDFWASSYSPQTGANVTLFAKGELEYDGHDPDADDNLEIEGIQFDWDWSNGWYETTVSKETPGAITYDDLTDVYENTYDIDVGTMSGLSIIVNWGNYTYQYEFYGLYNENGSRAGSVDLSVHLPSGTVSYPLNGNLTEGFNEQPELFSWSLAGGGTRFIFPYKVNESSYIFTPDTTYSVYSFTIKDYTKKIGSSNAWLESIRSVNGTERMVERQLIWDTYNPVPLTLAQSRIYILQIRFQDGSIYRFGYFVPGSEGTPTLYLYDIDFSDQAHIATEHIIVEATRPTDTHIRVNYKDELDDTNSVFVEVCLLNGTQVWNDTNAGGIIQFNWHGADNETDYRVNVEITHGFYGELTYTCWLAGARATEELPDLSLFGSWPIEDGIAVFLIIGTACLFSRGSGVIGIGVTVLVASIVSGIGMITIPYSVLATCFALVVMWGLSGGSK